MLHSEAKFTDTPHPEGRCHGMYRPDTVCLDISCAEGQYAAHFCLVRIFMGGSLLVQYVR